MNKKQHFIHIIIITFLILLFPMQKDTEAQAQKASPKHTAVLPQHKGDDIACYLIVKPKEKMNVNFHFLSEHRLQSDLSMKYDLILPVGFTEYFQNKDSGISISVNLDTYRKDEKEGESTDAAQYLIRMENGKPVLVCEADSSQQEIKKVGNYYKAEINYTVNSLAYQGEIIEKLCVNNHIEILNSEYDKTIYFDNIKILSGN